MGHAWAVPAAADKAGNCEHPEAIQRAGKRRDWELVWPLGDYVAEAFQGGKPGTL